MGDQNYWNGNYYSTQTEQSKYDNIFEDPNQSSFTFGDQPMNTQGIPTLYIPTQAPYPSSQNYVSVDYTQAQPSVFDQWEEVFSQTHKKYYYYNRVTGLTRWTKPTNERPKTPELLSSDNDCNKINLKRE